MTDEQHGADTGDIAAAPANGERRAAHERLSTGALARWARACATHPWRVIAGWIGIVAVLIVLVGTVGGACATSSRSRARTRRRRRT